MKTMVQRMQESADGTGKGAEAYDKLNISVTDLNGNLKSQEDVFDETARALMGMPEGAEKSKLAFELFGKAGLELMPLLNGTEESLDDLKQAASDMGLVLSDEAIDAGVNFTDMKDNVVRSLGAVTANIGVQLMPMFMKMFDWVMDNMPEIQRIIGVVMDWIGKFVMIVVDIFKDYLIPIMQAVFDWVKENWPIIQSIIKGVFDGIKLVWDKVLSPVLTLLWDVFKGIVKWISDNWETISYIFSLVFNAIKSIWDNILAPVMNLLLDALKAVVNFVADRFEGMKDIVESTFGAIGKAVDAVSDTFSWLADKIKDAWDWLKKWNDTPAKKKETSTTQDAGYSQFRIPLKSGLDYVPYDNYKVDLHKGERVLTAQENKDYSKGNDNLAKDIVNALIAAGITKPANIVLDGKAVGKGLIEIVDNGLNKNSSDEQIGRGVLV